MVTPDMPSRKRGLYEGADAFVSLPGGMGSFEETTEVLSWRQLGRSWTAPSCGECGGCSSALAGVALA